MVLSCPSFSDDVTVCICIKGTLFIKDGYYQFDCCGVVESWTFHAKSTGTLTFQVWRQDGSSYRNVGQNVFTVPSKYVSLWNDTVIIVSLLQCVLIYRVTFKSPCRCYIFLYTYYIMKHKWQLFEYEFRKILSWYIQHNLQIIKDRKSILLKGYTILQLTDWKQERINTPTYQQNTKYMNSRSKLHWNTHVVLCQVSVTWNNH